MNIQVTGDKVSENDQKIFDNVKENVLTLGAFSYINSMELWLGGKFYHHSLIGRFCSLSWHLTFLVARNHNYKAFTTHAQFNSSKTSSKNPRQIVIGHDVWVGHGAMILGGVKIGNGAVIGANAVVAKNIPPYAIAVGNPARVIKYRFDEETIKKFLAIKWWNWDIKKSRKTFHLHKTLRNFWRHITRPRLKNSLTMNLHKSLTILRGGGQRIYQIIADFEEKSHPLWHKVIKDFKQANLADAVLVIWLGENATEENSQALTAAIGDSKNILIFKHEEKFSPAALRKATHFITTREMSTLAALDYLWNTDVKILSALDINIFGG